MRDAEGRASREQDNEQAGSDLVREAVFPGGAEGGQSRKRRGQKNRADGAEPVNRHDGDKTSKPRAAEVRGIQPVRALFVSHQDEADCRSGEKKGDGERQVGHDEAKDFFRVSLKKSFGIARNPDGRGHRHYGQHGKQHAGARDGPPVARGCKARFGREQRPRGTVAEQGQADHQVRQVVPHDEREDARQGDFQDEDRATYGEHGRA